MRTFQEKAAQIAGENKGERNGDNSSRGMKGEAMEKAAQIQPPWEFIIAQMVAPDLARLHFPPGVPPPPSGEPPPGAPSLHRWGGNIVEYVANRLVDQQALQHRTDRHGATHCGASTVGSEPQSSSPYASASAWASQDASYSTQELRPAADKGWGSSV